MPADAQQIQRQSQSQQHQSQHQSQQQSQQQPKIQVVKLATDVRHVKTNQTALVSVSSRMSAQGSQMPPGYTAIQENNYVYRPANQSHTQTRIDSFFSSGPINSHRNVSSLNSSLRKNSMETPLPQEIKGVTGLMNMRNTCYLNATLQALRHNTEMTSFFLENKHDQWVNRKQNEPKVELVRGYSDLLKALWSGSKPAYIKPEGFLQAMMPAAKAAGFDHFLIPHQHDSHECLVFLLDQIHEGLAEEVNIQITRGPPQTPKDRAIQSALESWKGFFGKQYSPFTEMIYGLLRVTMTCKTCEKSVDTWETFNCLKMPIPNKASEPPTIEQMLQEEMKEEEIEGYACDHCKPNRTVAVRKSTIWRLPRMLCLVAKRFTVDNRKIHTPIQFSNHESITFGQFFSPDSPEPSQKQAYQCFAIVDHHGSSGGGHYVAQAKSPLSDKWNLFNDESTQSLSGPVIGQSNYIYFLKAKKA